MWCTHSALVPYQNILPYFYAAYAKSQLYADLIMDKGPIWS